MAAEPMELVSGLLYKVTDATKNVFDYTKALTVLDNSFREWDALLDPAVLVRTIPGCERLEATGGTDGDHPGNHPADGDPAAIASGRFGSERQVTDG